eukprot:TRINITY_DN4139_c0_g1_i1.p1 TRINITY_DN4139_c0_g1~~TRINITY_DN4139_c0_g1_i1.p1  ORF type:complete len:380 (+),score=89.16 TRINITY_DN4139_c0_g1_i1:50-1189(+)
MIRNISQCLNVRNHARSHRNEWNHKSRSYRRHNSTFYENRSKTVKRELILSGVLFGAALLSCTFISDEHNAEESYFIGVDGGGTKTELVLIDSEGSVVSRIVCGSSNRNSVGEDQTKENLRNGLKVLLDNANIPADHVNVVWFSMSGVDRPTDKQKLRNWVSDIFPETTQLKISNDSYGALASGTSGELNNNIVVISGTGSICVGFNSEGEPVRTGGWGPMINDESSGYYMGSRLLRAISEHADGGKQTVLYELFMKQNQLEHPSEIITWTYDGKEWSDIASLSKLVYQGVQSGDEVAISILKDTTNNITHMIDLTLNKMDHCDTVVLSGGNLTHENSKLAEMLVDSLKVTHPQIKVSLPTIDPAQAAAMLAKNLKIKD